MSSGKQVTLYYPIVIAKDAKQGENNRMRTGIYFPEAYQPSANLDLVVYFHGLLDRCGGSGDDSVEQYWRNPHFRLRELTDASKKNVVLVVPRLGARDKKTGSKLGMDGDEFLKKVLEVVVDRVKTEPFSYTSAMAIRNIILAAHSGGGLTMLRLAQTVTVSKVRECWGFDSMYQLPQEWANWAATGGKYFLFWTSEGGINSDYYGNNVDGMNKILGNTKDPTAALAVPNVLMEYSPKPKAFPSTTTSHCDVPKTYWADMMKRFP
jgi:hypothetical protein